MTDKFERISSSLNLNEYMSCEIENSFDIFMKMYVSTIYIDE